MPIHLNFCHSNEGKTKVIEKNQKNEKIKKRQRRDSNSRGTSPIDLAGQRFNHSATLSIATISETFHDEELKAIITIYSVIIQSTISKKMEEGEEYTKDNQIDTEEKNKIEVQRRKGCEVRKISATT